MKSFIAVLYGLVVTLLALASHLYNLVSFDTVFIVAILFSLTMK